jgi:NAD(P)-dependent dehydrogenase (short-subunit alcohol dehydrogenase family)
MNDAELHQTNLTGSSYFSGRKALVTGASSGVGRAIAIALSRQGAAVCVVGRNPANLAETAACAREFSAEVTELQVDLTDETQLPRLLRVLEKTDGRLDILVHGAGVIFQDPLLRAAIEDLDIQYATNVRAPYLLTQRLLPLLTAARGQIVFLNSSAALTARRPEIGQYSATKHALKAIADSLREEVNPEGVRVLSVYLGRTATPMQEAICRQEGRVYCPERLLQPNDVASVVINALALPCTAEVTEISIRPMAKTLE